MKEFMLLIRNLASQKESLSPDEHLAFVKKCEVYINELKSKGQLISAQPMERTGKMISGSPGNFSESPYSTSDEVIVGYYHILANDLDEAICIAKRNPEFEYSSTARVEVRPVKMKEQRTGFVYPK